VTQITDCAICLILLGSLSYVQEQGSWPFIDSAAIDSPLARGLHGTKTRNEKPEELIRPSGDEGVLSEAELNARRDRIRKHLVHLHRRALPFLRV
jgi:hypothetical protein